MHLRTEYCSYFKNRSFFEFLTYFQLYHCYTLHSIGVLKVNAFVVNLSKSFNFETGNENWSNLFFSRFKIIFIWNLMQDQINTAVKLGKEKTMKYPNVTVCFAKFFDMQLIEGIFQFLNVCTVDCSLGSPIVMGLYLLYLQLWKSY